MSLHLEATGIPGRLALIALAALTICAACAGPEVDRKESIAPEAATGFRQIEARRAPEAMVVSANPHASRAGLAILKKGGTATDATIAMALVLTLVEPQSSGIGGGAFLLHFTPDGTGVEGYDGREMAPAAASPTMFLDEAGEPREFFDTFVGGLSVGAPGLLRMLEMVHAEHGKLPWKELFGPALALAREGFELSPRLHSLLEQDPVLKTMEPAASYFYKPDGSPKDVGTVLKNPLLASTLEELAEGGAEVFYTGPIAKDIVETVKGAQKNPGLLTLADLGAYKAVKREPVCAPYREHRVCGMAPPTSGGVTLLEILGVLSHFDLSAMSANSAEFIHLFAESSRLAYADRGLYLADSDFVSIPIEGLLAPEYLESRAALISTSKSMGKASAGKPKGTEGTSRAPDQSPELPSTSHLVVVDAQGNAVSMTASIEMGFGSHLMVRGFLLNNQLTDFSFVPEVDGAPVANRPEAGKRPRSSMAPTVVLDKEGKNLVMAIGSPGGSRIIPYVARAIIDVLDFGMNMQEAIDQPNLSNRNGQTELEDVEGNREWAEATKRKLEALGHEVEIKDMNSGLHGLRRVDGVWEGGADPRREGLVEGY